MNIGLELVGLLLVTSHMVCIGLLVAWFGLNQPTSIPVFRQRLRAAFHRKSAAGKPVS